MSSPGRPKDKGRSAQHDGTPVSPPGRLTAGASSDAAGPEVPCPTCGKPSLFAPANPWRPFCGETCRTIDLGAWASERFRLPAGAPADDDTLPPLA